MGKWCAKQLITLCLAFGLLAPMVSGALVTLIPGMNYVYICTGTETVILVLDKNGTPIDVQQESEQDCAIPEHTLLPNESAPLWQHLILEPAVTRLSSFNENVKSERFDLLPLKRSPSYLI